MSAGMVRVADLPPERKFLSRRDVAQLLGQLEAATLHVRGSDVEALTVLKTKLRYWANGEVTYIAKEFEPAPPAEPQQPEIKAEDCAADKAQEG